MVLISGIFTVAAAITYYKYIWVGSLTYFFMMVPRFLLSTQYLKTSLTLPKILTEVKIEQIEKEARPDPNSFVKLDVMKIDNQLANLNNSGSESSDHDMTMVQTFQRCDAVVKKQAESVKRIHCFTTTLNVFLLISACFVAYLFDNNGLTLLDDNMYFLFNIISYILLVWAVYSMRQTIISTNFAVPKQRFIVLHTLNFTLYLLLYATRIGFIQHVDNLAVNKDDSAETKLMYTKAMFQT